jgi:hypothetical protein
MINFSLDFFAASISLIPYFLRQLGSDLKWETEQGLIWVTATFEAWGSAGTGRHTDFVSTLVSPISFLNQRFVDLSTELYYRLNLTGQVIYIEHYLNDLFDADLRRIYLSDDSLLFPPFLYNKNDIIPAGEELVLYPNSNPIILYNQSDYFDQPSFVVNVPSAIPVTPYLENRVRAAVNYYKQAGAKYSVINF